MTDRIRLLPEVVANQIAAGEVVNRPASVVKEMMENAIDAGARTIQVNYRDGGKELIQVVDDGSGMSPIDARMAFDRHATSKIASVDDIYALHTFGFRGEALASIAAVAEVELRTRQEGDELGTQTVIHGGQFRSQTPVACPAGSQFFVRNLFYNVPARRRFLEKSAASAAQIRSEFQRVALCYPRIAFELYANDAPLYTLGATTLAGRIVDVVGRHIKQNLLEVEADTSIARLEGYVGRPEAAKRRNAEQYLFVNGRFFKSAYLTSAVLKAYEKLIPQQTTPSYFLYLSVEPARIDVNVHPQKTEVRFADEEAVWQIVHAAVRETLAKTGAVPMMDFDRDEGVDIPVLKRGEVYREPRAAMNEAYNPFRDSRTDADAGPGMPEGFDAAPFDRDGAVADAGLRRGEGAGAPGGGRSGGMGFGAGAAEFGTEFGTGFGAGFEEIASEGFGGDASTFDIIESGADAAEQRLELGGGEAFTDPLPLGNSLVAALRGGRLVVVDAKRARERILYEEYLRMVGGASAASQQLLFPERLVLSTEEYALLEEHAVEVAALGFDVEMCGGGAVEVKGTPAELPPDAVDRMLYELLQAFSTPVEAADARREHIAAVMARGAARMTPRMLSREEAADLLRRLAATGHAAHTPSGKAIFTEFAPEELRARLG